MSEKEMCVDCDFVSQAECKEHREKFEGCLKGHEDRLNKNDVENAKIATEMRGIKWVLCVILGVILTAWLTSIF